MVAHTLYFHNLQSDAYPLNSYNLFLQSQFSIFCLSNLHLWANSLFLNLSWHTGNKLQCRLGAIIFIRQIWDTKEAAYYIVDIGVILTVLQEKDNWANDGDDVKRALRRSSVHWRKELRYIERWKDITSVLAADNLKFKCSVTQTCPLRTSSSHACFSFWKLWTLYLQKLFWSTCSDGRSGYKLKCERSRQADKCRPGNKNKQPLMKWNQTRMELRLESYYN